MGAGHNPFSTGGPGVRGAMRLNLQDGGLRIGTRRARRFNQLGGFRRIGNELVHAALVRYAVRDRR
jgi:hypothetical protein